MSEFRLIENIEVLACRNSAERVVKALNRGEVDQAKQLARKHEIAWHLADREFQTLNQPHRSIRFAWCGKSLTRWRTAARLPSAGVMA